MYDFKRVLVCLDFTEIDQNLIQVAGNLLNEGVSDKIYFFHSVKKLELSSEFLEKYPDLAAPVDEALKKTVQDELSEYLKAGTGPENIEILIAEGNPFDQILKWAGIKEIDLIIMGKKPPLEASFELPERVIKFTLNSVLLVTKAELRKSRKQLVPIDFSDYSAMAVNQAIKLQEIMGSEIVCQHIFSVPSGYHTTGKSYDEFVEIMKQNARVEFQKFIKSNDLEGQGLECIMELSEGDEPTQIFDTANRINADLIVMGSKGRTQLANLVLGSTSMKMVKHKFDIPLLIVKDKHQNLGLLDAILKL